MTEIRAESSLSPTELVVLACLSQSREPSDDALSTAVLELCMPDEPEARARAAAADAINALRARGLVTTVTGGSSKKTARKNQVAQAGERALCAAFGLTDKPTWAAVRDKHLPTLGLGLQPGSEVATKAMSGASSIEAAVLRAKVGNCDATKVTELCDLLIAETLGMPPGAVTLDRIRIHVLARRASIAYGAEDKLAQFSQRVVANIIGVSEADLRDKKRRKKALVRALGYRGLRKTKIVARVQDGSAPASEPPDHLLESERPSRSPELRLVPRSTTASPPLNAEALHASQVRGENLLEVVRKAISQVGADGRFGAEKVFVSALWQRIEHGHRPVDLSLDGFKRWLVTANRDGWLVLARADLIGAMDPRKVAESEIRDQGATFHFVLDAQRGAGSHGGTHVR